MKLIIVSGEEELGGEASLVNELLEAGLFRFHLRKHHFTEEETRRYLDHISPANRRAVVLHQHHYLRDEYDLGGIHFNRHWPESNTVTKPENTTFSVSLHFLQELEETQENIDYIFLGPVFNSISKPEYNSYFSGEELQETLAGKTHPFEVFAIGGMDAGKASLIKRWGFDGMAVLGSFWNQYMRKGKAGALETFRELSETLAHASE